MATVKAKHLGDLADLACNRICTKVQQESFTGCTDSIITGKGDGFSLQPTRVPRSLAACAMTLMGIYAKNNGIDLTGAEIEITKKMAAEPRRIAEIDVIFNMPANGYSEKEKKILERVAHTCPVHLSLHPRCETKFRV